MQKPNYANGQPQFRLANGGVEFRYRNGALRTVSSGRLSFQSQGQETFHMIGTVTDYFADGKTKAVYTLVLNDIGTICKHGKEIIYHHTGKFKEISTYEMGRLHGVKTTYSRHGFKISEGYYTNGDRRPAWLTFKERELFDILFSELSECYYNELDSECPRERDNVIVVNVIGG